MFITPKFPRDYEKWMLMYGKAPKSKNSKEKPASKDLRLPFPIRVYEARHTHANVLMNAAAPLKFIQDALGHGSPLATQRYLASFEDENAARYVASVVPERVRESVQKQLQADNSDELE